MRNPIAFFLVFVVMIVLVGCGNSQEFNDAYLESLSIIKTAHTKGAIAIATGTESSPKSRSLDSRVVARSQDNDSIYTILKNYDYHNTLSFDVDALSGRRPSLLFTAISNDFLFVVFESVFGLRDLGVYAINLTTEKVHKAKLPKNTSAFFRHWEPISDGEDDDLIIFGSDGIAYFIVFSFVGNDRYEHVVSWNPSVSESINVITPAVKGAQIADIQLDDEDRLYVHGVIYGPRNSTDFLQVYDTRIEKGKYIIYNDKFEQLYEYVTSKSSVFVNGYDISGINGLVKFDVNVVDGELYITRTPIITNEIILDYDWRGVSVSAISKLTFFDDGSLWGIYEDNNKTTKSIRLIDSMSNQDTKVIHATDALGAPVHAEKIKYNKNIMYYRYRESYDVYHKLASLDSDGNFRDLTANIPDNRIKDIIIYDYTIADDKLYFSGWDGINSLAGCIDLDTLEYKEISKGLSINTIKPIF